MTIDSLFSELCRRKIRLSTDGTDVRIKAPKGALTDALKATVKAFKPGIIATLTGKVQKSHIPGIVWDQRGGVRLSRAWYMDPVTYGHD